MIYAIGVNRLTPIREPMISCMQHTCSLLRGKGTLFSTC